jgi:hypothetical protein
MQKDGRAEKGGHQHAADEAGEDLDDRKPQAEGDHRGNEG